MSAAGIEPVLVVGAGPVGLLLAARLMQHGVRTRLIERRRTPSSSSRAIGVHPPGLAALASVGADAAVRAAGVRIEGGRAYGASGPLGRLVFAADAPVWSLPQWHSEAALLAALEGFGGTVERGVTLTDLQRAGGGRLLATLQGDGVERFEAGIVIGCDGRASSVRTLAGIGWRGGPYRDRYLMADLPDVTGLAHEASIHLHPEGLAESFPLPGGWRRVVVRHQEPAPEPQAPGVDARLARLVCDLAAARGAGRFDPDAARMTSAFGIEAALATRFALGRVLLAGDAAHVLSPIGGQGMNLGWLDAVAAADALARVRERGTGALEPELAAYAQSRRRAAQLASWRATFNTALGRPAGALRARWRDALLRRALRPPFARGMVGAFTMRGLA